MGRLQHGKVLWLSQPLINLPKWTINRHWGASKAWRELSLTHWVMILHTNGTLNELVEKARSVSSCYHCLHRFWTTETNWTLTILVLSRHRPLLPLSAAWSEGVHSLNFNWIDGGLKDSDGLLLVPCFTFFSRPHHAPYY